MLSSPSGAGKSTLAKMLLEADDEIAMSVSVTTRPKRPGEEHGKDYYFVTGDEFEEIVADHGFIALPDKTVSKEMRIAQN